MTLFWATFGNSKGVVLGQDYVEAPTYEQARQRAKQMCARHESVLWLDQINPIQDKGSTKEP